MRRVLSVLLLVAALAVAAVLLATSLGTPPGSGEVEVSVVFADGRTTTANVSLDHATAFTALQALADEHDWQLEVEGSGEDLFVVGIAGQRNQGAAGWCYAIHDGDRSVRPPYSAAVAGLQDGQAVTWRYEPDGCGPLG